MAAAQLRERDRALAEAFEAEEIEFAMLGEQQRRLDAVAREAGTAADAQRVNRPGDCAPPGRTGPSTTSAPP
jgi:hypothetical protein